MYKLIVLLLLLSCTDSNTSKTVNQPTAVKDIEINSVEIVSTGGGLGYHSCMLIDKDSTHYKQTVAANPANNSEYHKKTIPQDWMNLTAKINLEEFKSAKEGKSVQPVDGIDTKIVIISVRDRISKMNAYNDKSWKNMVEYIYHE